jgi:opacity protein-like surface antigen
MYVMSKFVYVKFLILLLICSFQFASAKQSGNKDASSNPVGLGQKNIPVKIEVFGGINNPLSPSEIVNKPKIAVKDVQQSLLNGLDGLGYGPTINFGAAVKYPFSETYYMGVTAEYSGWQSNNSCNCNDVIGKSENSLSLLHFGLLSQYYLIDNLYASIELGLNLLDAKVVENSNRGVLDFSKSYTRIGAGLGLGYEIPLTDIFALNISAKGQFPNLLLGEENSGKFESLINSGTDTKEATLFLLSLNIGLLFSL